MPKPDELSLLLDHWIIVRTDGTPVLNGKPEDFEVSLRTLMWMERTGAKYQELPEDFPEPTCVLIRPKDRELPEGKFCWDPQGVDS